MKQWMGQTGNERRNKKLREEKWNKNTMVPNLWKCNQSYSERELYSNKGLPQEARKISNK